MTVEQDDLQLEIPDERFHVVDAESANWVVRHIVESRKYVDHVEQWAAAEIRRARRQEAFFMGRWGGELKEFARRKNAEQFRRKSFALPAGTIGFRVEPLRIDIRDEPCVLAWCRINLPSAIKRTETLLKSALMDHFQQHGELPSGAEIDGKKERFFIR